MIQAVNAMAKVMLHATRLQSQDVHCVLILFLPQLRGPTDTALPRSCYGICCDLDQDIIGERKNTTFQPTYQTAGIN